MIHPRLPVMHERAVLPKDTLGDSLGEGRTVDPELVLLADALIPATQQETGVIHIVVEMMMREEEIVDFRRKEPGLHQFVSSCWAAIEHQVIAGDLDDMRRSKPVRCWNSPSPTENIHLGHRCTSDASQMWNDRCNGDRHCALAPPLGALAPENGRCFDDTTFRDDWTASCELTL